MNSVDFHRGFIFIRQTRIGHHQFMIMGKEQSQLDGILCFISQTLIRGGKRLIAIDRSLTAVPDSKCSAPGTEPGRAVR